MVRVHHEPPNYVGDRLINRTLLIGSRNSVKNRDPAQEWRIGGIGRPSTLRTCRPSGHLGSNPRFATIYNRYMDQKQRDRARADRNRKRIKEYKLSKGCIDCGYNKHPAALEFDHLPQYIKINTVASLCYAAWDKIQAEIDKCEVVCSNCHSIRSASRKWHK